MFLFMWIVTVVKYYDVYMFSVPPNFNAPDDGRVGPNM
jgi:hypothetical protein